MFLKLLKILNKEKYLNARKGVSLVEIILSIALFALITSALASSITFGLDSIYQSGYRVKANLLAEEGLESVRSIRDLNFNLLTNGEHGTTSENGKWELTASENNLGEFKRKIIISSLDADTKNIISEVSWKNGKKIKASSILTRWKDGTYKKKGGMLLFSGGGPTSDLINYKTIDGDSGLWSEVKSAGDIDILTTNKVPRITKAFSSASRNEKVLVSKHFNGTTQFIYAQIFNGNVWSNINLLSTWNSTLQVDIENFDGVYISSGEFVVFYSDNTTIPKYKIWNGTTWSNQYDLPDLGRNSEPMHLISRQRDGTNEIMVAILDKSRNSKTLYYNGKSFSLSNWTLHSRHSNNAPSN